MIYHSTYFGVLIYQQRYPLRWLAYPGRGRVMADTLAGIKHAIREATQEERADRESAGRVLDEMARQMKRIEQEDGK